jgi:hypothetical protein
VNCCPRWFCLVIVIAMLAPGCEKPPQFGQVTGTVTMDGEPLDRVRVLFMPDPNAGNQGAHSECITGEDGTYDLVYSKDAQNHGALLGWHRVVVEDIAAEESRDAYRPIRVPDLYLTSAKTPLRYEIKPEPQTIDIQVDER